MEIAKGIGYKDYLKLNLSDYENDDWMIAIGYLEKRLTDRFIEPADQLIKLESDKNAIDKKYGFAVLALDCLLLETIQSFYEGISNSSGKSKALFIQFLQNRKNFKEYFKTELDAVKFYKDFRCGILHQGQTGRDTKVWSVGDLILKNNGFVIVNRHLFHEKIKIELEEYIKILRTKSDTGLLDNFKIKMDFICHKK
ncbi:hypothetical protein [Maribacter sp. R86514]|uniref:hypothetical protein n=1 Tax=Maribacter sp. R86514 TaxID=3093854 RepID=UPI0037CB8B4A